MTRSIPLSYPPSTTLVHDTPGAKDKAFFPVRIPVSHWQLRHYISSPEEDILYYASGHDVFCLNTRSRKRRHVATLPFEARCTASGYGWVCVGGEEEGRFAAIRVGSERRRRGREEDEMRGGGQVDGEEESRAPAAVRVERIGDEIVNSISIHRLRDEDAHLDDIVAILTNNDKTVRVYSLTLGQETTVLDLPFAMNHATLSPNGQTLLAVGDFNQAYFFSRQILAEIPQIPKPHNRLTSEDCGWCVFAVITLHSTANTYGYFTTAWSPSGNLVAVGSEGGYISVFDVSLLLDPEFQDRPEEAIVAVVPGSRPEQVGFPGAVRAMMFAPEPWDLLIWAEDQGRVCIGDLRTGLKTKQTVELDTNSQDLRKLVFSDVGGTPAPALGRDGGPARDLDALEADFLRRYRAAPDNASAVNFATEYIEARRRQRMQRQDLAALRARANEAGVDALEHDPQGLTVREQQILESLRTSRLREEARARGAGAGVGVHYTSPDMFISSSSATTSTPTTTRLGDGARMSRPLAEILRSTDAAAVPDASMPELSRTSGGRATWVDDHDRAPTLPSLDEIQDSISGRQSSQQGQQTRGTGSGSWFSSSRATAEGSRLPRRTQSVVLSPSGTAHPSTSATTRDAGSRRAPAATAATAATPPPQQQDDDDQEDNPWRQIEAHMSLARGPLFEGAGRVDAASPVPAQAQVRTRPSEEELQAELAAERARARSLARQRERLRRQGLDVDAAGPPAEAPTGRATATAAARASSSFRDGYEALLRRSQAQPEAGLTVRSGMMAMSGPVGGPGYVTAARDGGVVHVGGVGSGREFGVRTAGLAMSPDGRVLWCATEEGIFEVKVGVKGRMGWGVWEAR